MGDPGHRGAGAGVLKIRLRGLTAQIVLWTVLPLTLVLIGVAFTGVYGHEQAMRELVEERDQALATVTAAQIGDLLQSRIVALEGLAAEQPFHHADLAGQRQLLATAGSLDGFFADVPVLMDSDGPVVAAVAPPAWTEAEGLPDMVQGVLAGQEPVLAATRDTPWGEDATMLGVPVFDGSGTAYGVLVAPMLLSSLGLESALSQVQVGARGAVYLVDGAGRILARAPVDRSRSSLAGHTGLTTALQDDVTGATPCHAPDGERMTLAYAPVAGSGLGWRVLIEEPWNEVIGPVLRYSRLMPLVAVLATIVSMLALYYGVRSIAQPLQALGQQAELVAWGDFQATAKPVGGVQEIEDLRRTLDQMAHRIHVYQRGMHDYIAAITQGQEEERKRLARELHDETAQALIALNQQVEMAQKLVDSDPDGAAERLAQARVNVAETLEGVRRFSRDLRPIYLEDLGFVPALEMLAREADQQEGLSVQWTLSGLARRLPADLELAAYRIVQEALNNVIQHAAAGQAWVEVRFEARRLVLSVRDDGQGFDAPDLPDALARQGHFGLMGIHERAFLYGGQLALRSAPGRGTDVVVRLPYPAQD